MVTVLTSPALQPTAPKINTMTTGVSRKSDDRKQQVAQRHGGARLARRPRCPHRPCRYGSAATRASTVRALTVSVNVELISNRCCLCDVTLRCPSDSASRQ